MTKIEYYKHSCNTNYHYILLAMCEALFKILEYDESHPLYNILICILNEDKQIFLKYLTHNLIEKFNKNESLKIRRRIDLCQILIEFILQQGECTIIQFMKNFELFEYEAAYSNSLNVYIKFPSKKEILFKIYYGLKNFNFRKLFNEIYHSITTNNHSTMINKSHVWQDHFDNNHSAVCPCCKKQEINMANFQNCHIIPESQGGKNHIYNYVPLCYFCRSSKSDKYYFDFCKNYNL